MRKLDYYWKTNKDWYYRKENGACVVKDTAPEEAKRSCEHFPEQSREAEKRASWINAKPTAMGGFYWEAIK